MSKSRKISLSVIAIAIVIMFGLSFVDTEPLSTRVTNTGNKAYYEDSEGNIWASQKDYDSASDNSKYYVSPEDGSLWENEYRYQLSKQG